MNIIIADTYEEMSRKAADVIADCLAKDPSCVLGLATGSTPIGLYAELVRDCEAGKISFADATTFNLDEYRGLDPRHDQSYRYFMQQNLFDHVNVDVARTHVPDGSNPDADAACAAYEEAIAQAGGVDLQLLGLGHNGHIGFNEPCDCFPVDTHVVELTESTIQANSRLFDSIDEVPREAYTMGIGTIMRAAKVLVVANGEGKAQIVRDAFFGPVTPQVPASVLQLHPDVTVIVDKEAGALLG
ncbi:MAG: putative glucosamine-6-phosphate deaminase 2 [Paraeggerthella hongkongensis]|uniref:glucosamine-6-phosphate deaminase n=1 Tax=Paraeggerthella TaxID=651554 RepID=UPI001C1095DB|nr:glucosamine-6-phosphate deaminase [Paraeggerthella sp. Marseille-Q4926]MBU5405860.1 glucosamine-6-phosphate deaminase [Paraeggerthella hongkongensis]MCD2433707.1 glucosamine-6-phosphate deaminase [Paraeggerthella hominis]MDY3980978.1 glucosamine-6-phosphate deaminase [Paraeggerthella sp.]